ncbi:MAG: chemotaxis protein CheX [Planctomycetes bacterium]|nr:chemotaxis protein CheX [Planctomycetota bacterium]
MAIAQTLDNILFTSINGLFKAYGQPMEEAKNGGFAIDGAWCAMVGFGGPTLSGALILTVAADLVSRTCQVSELSPRDWIGELANQLAGRVKNRLLPYGIVIQVQIPVVVRRERLAPLDGPGLPCVTMQAQNGSRVAACIDHIVHDPESVEALSRGDLEVPREGDVILF